jgi:hypothetical protein
MSGLARPLSSFLFLVASSSSIATIAVACGANEGEGATTPTSNKPRPADTTEVTMERSSFDASEGTHLLAAGSSSSSSSSSSSTSTSSSSSSGGSSSGGPDVADDPNIGGKQSDPQIEAAVAPIRPRLRVCFKKAQAAEPNVGGTATFDATIGADGHVASARFVKREGLSEDMMGCLTTAVKAMFFEKGKKSQIVTFNFGSPPKPAMGSGDAGKP